MKKIFIFLLLAISVSTGYAQSWHQAGIKVSTNFATQRSYSDDGVSLDGLVNPDFYLFFRAGKIIYGEIGFGYNYFKGDFSQKNGPLVFYKDQTVIFHNLLIPVKLVAYIPMGKVCALEPFVGILYQPTVAISANDINFTKKTIEDNMVYLDAGLDLKFGPILIGASYKYGLCDFFPNRSGKKPQFVNVCVGFQF